VRLRLACFLGEGQFGGGGAMGGAGNAVGELFIEVKLGVGGGRGVHKAGDTLMTRRAARQASIAAILRSSCAAASCVLRQRAHAMHQFMLNVDEGGRPPAVWLHLACVLTRDVQPGDTKGLSSKPWVLAHHSTPPALCPTPTLLCPSAQ
jgi:hypothetical protein